jgi:hypothetical protein
MFGSLRQVLSTVAEILIFVVTGWVLLMGAMLLR